LIEPVPRPTARSARNVSVVCGRDDESKTLRLLWEIKLIVSIISLTLPKSHSRNETPLHEPCLLASLIPSRVVRTAVSITAISPLARSSDTKELQLGHLTSSLKMDVSKSVRGNLARRSWNKEAFWGLVSVLDSRAVREMEMCPVCPAVWIVCTRRWRASWGDKEGTLNVPVEVVFVAR